jgi:hypothetical protein
VFRYLAPRQEIAIERAKRVEKNHLKTGTTDNNPSTEMYQFVEYLESIAG